MKLKWLIWAERALLLTVLLMVGVLTFLNVRDYRRYKFITELERHVTPEQFAAMTRVCEGKERHYSNEIREVEMAPEFAVLDPVSVAASEECFYLKLYERGYDYAALSLSSTPRNQRVHLNHIRCRHVRILNSISDVEQASGCSRTPSGRIRTMFLQLNIRGGWSGPESCWA